MTGLIPGGIGARNDVIVSADHRGTSMALRLCLRLEQRLDFLHPEDKILEQHVHMLQLCLRLRLCLHHHPHLCLQTI